MYKKLDNFSNGNGNYDDDADDDSYVLYKHDYEYYLLLSSSYGLQRYSPDANLMRIGNPVPDAPVEIRGTVKSLC